MNGTEEMVMCVVYYFYYACYLDPKLLNNIITNL